MALGFLGALAILALSTGLNLLLKPRVKRPRSPALELPRAEEGVPIPLAYGTVPIAPNVVYWKAGPQVSFTNGTTGYTVVMVGTLCMGPVDELTDIIVGGKSLAFEPVTAAQGGTAGDPQVITPNLPYNRTLLGGSADTPTEFIIHARNMFGGNEQEGGIQGTLEFHWGGLDQTADDVTTQYMVDAGYSAGTGRPGICYFVLSLSENGDSFYVGTVPQPKEFVFVLRHNPTALGVGMDGRDANPAEVMFDLMHNNLRGLGLPTGLSDIDAYTEVAETLKGEPLGISPCFSQQDEVEDMAEDCLKHAFAVNPINPVTGKFTPKLARPDYVVGEVLRVTTGLRGATYANAWDLKSSRPNYRETTNDIQVTYRRFESGIPGDVNAETLGTYPAYRAIAGERTIYLTEKKPIFAVSVYGDGVELQPITNYDFDSETGRIVVYFGGAVQAGTVLTVSYTATPTFSGYKEAVARWQDLASLQTSGEIRSLTLDYPFYTNDLTAGYCIARLGRQISTPLWSVEFKMNRAGYSLAPGDVIRLNHEPEDAEGVEQQLFDDEPFRITEIDYGLLEDGTITVSAVEDIFGEDVVPFLPAPPGGANSGTQIVAPDMAISYSATSAIRVCLYTPDQNFNIRIWRANSDLGLGVTTGADVIATVPGTSTFYDDFQPMAARGPSVTTGRSLSDTSYLISSYTSGAAFQYGAPTRDGRMSRGAAVPASSVIMPAGDSIVLGTVYYYAAQLVPTTSQVGYTDGDLTPWQAMTATAGTPGACTCTIPTVSVSTSDIADVGTLTLTVTDPQNRVSLVEFQTKAGLGPLSEWTADTSPYVATVSTLGSDASSIAYRVTYLDCAGASVSNLTATVAFP
jgi:hypothetical protein